MAFASIFIFFCLVVFLVVECISLGFFVTGIILTICFIVISVRKKETIGNKVAIPIVLITLGITGLLPTILYLLGNI